MRGKITVSVLALAAVCVGTAAIAGPAYTAEDIVRKFAPADPLGKTRGLCVGTHSECNTNVDSRSKAAGAFDLVVNFEYNSDALTPAAKQNLDEFAKALQDARLRSASFVVEGHTDARGGEEFNLGLSTRRADAVVKYLSGRGVPQGQLTARGFGKSRPLTDDPLDPANRRVETRLAIQ
ncbi:OmpA family protein [Methylobacterium nodulans]|uniref:OmpA/MotB domain protein n=1 Tax=Methylobacterium nodulans (strain LMG 21967 / CNCM I-2342 / ORS 2060) TaxID=460265 RepID=B8ILZ0_METNO|nr:OmpA family protein [Methylobacterium nodulans]ACL56334.1 OmpA/MotB domain protein [Methylobacterium nodulans ORS 2060]